MPVAVNQDVASLLAKGIKAMELHIAENVKAMVAASPPSEVNLSLPNLGAPDGRDNHATSTDASPSAKETKHRQMKKAIYQLILPLSMATTGSRPDDAPLLAPFFAADKKDDKHVITVQPAIHVNGYMTKTILSGKLTPDGIQNFCNANGVLGGHCLFCKMQFDSPAMDVIMANLAALAGFLPKIYLKHMLP